MSPAQDSLVEDMRAFNRFYTARMGLLAEGLAHSPFPLPQARLLYELGHRGGATAAELCRALDLDKGYLSRLVARLMARGLIGAAADPAHGRRRRLALTPSGTATLEQLEDATRRDLAALLAPLQPGACDRLAAGMRLVRDALDGNAVAPIVLRPPQAGDLGRVIAGQARLYTEEYGWDWTFEAMLAGLVADFVRDFDPSCEACWIADRGGDVVGSVFLVRGGEPGTAKLRMLYVAQEARGAGVGTALLEACIARARACGYARLTLWTNDILHAARRLYERAGFRLVAEEPHVSFGRQLVGQTFLLDLTAGLHEP